MNIVIECLLGVVGAILNLACFVSPLYAIIGTIGIIVGTIRGVKVDILYICTALFSIPTMVVYYGRWLVDENLEFSKAFEFCGLIGMILIIVSTIVEEIRTRKEKKRLNNDSN